MSSIFGRKSLRTEQSIRDDVGSLGIRVQPIVFDPDRNVYELRFELPDCPKDLIKVTYDRPSGKLKVQGEKHLKGNFNYEVTVPPDCNANEIYGRFRGDVLTIIMPKSKTDLHSKSTLISKQEEVERTSSDGKTADKGREKVENDQELPAEVPAPSPSDRRTAGQTSEGSEKYQESAASVPAPPPPDPKMTDRVRERVEKYQKLLAEIIAPPSSNQKTTVKVTERVERDKNLPARVPAPQPLPSSPPGRKTTGKVLERAEMEQKSPTEVPAPPASDQTTTKDVMEGLLKKQESPADVPDSQPQSEQKTIEKIAKEVQEDRKLPTITKASSPPPSNQITAEQKDVEAKFESHREVVKSLETSEDKRGENLKKNESTSKSEDVAQPRKEKNPDRGVANSANSEPNTRENENKQPSAGKEKGVIATVKETGKAAIAAAMKEENRLVLVIGAAALAIAIIGAISLRSSRKVLK